MLSLETKLNRLFELRHLRDQPERSTDEVARAISQRVGRAVSPQILVDARAGRSACLAGDISDAVCAEFGVDSFYLRAEDSPEITRLDLVIQVLILIRDRGLHHLAGRIHDLDLDSIKAIIAILADSAPITHSDSLPSVP
ncbi:hypothetical protein IU500_18450 [Nocardia terpenica]|uniref:hypothetical protein n=1 Tax=Nocardia terpenica TaxID=455432 RepID=UPI0018950097|nr:hypothetical protein [Nocardia terpenica]MBF6063467.1 hypothetical protein [Nocardia terpenica]MBF6106023.1 hypothetical protein [Nocardia terpenica]MBF6113392.1 hypothetical protein [Nocardia terpenica]MBF6119764.1 hypothetical protein [Nocardia terpenica]MBF6152175.1 hypothetical protein [Nocardia terpenica]